MGMRASGAACACAATLWLSAIGYYAVKATGHGTEAGESVKLAIPLDRLPKQLNGWTGGDVERWEAWATELRLAKLWRRLWWALRGLPSRE